MTPRTASITTMPTAMPAMAPGASADDDFEPVSIPPFGEGFEARLLLVMVDVEVDVVVGEVPVETGVEVGDGVEDIEELVVWTWAGLVMRPQE